MTTQTSLLFFAITIGMRVSLHQWPWFLLLEAELHIASGPLFKTKVFWFPRSLPCMHWQDVTLFLQPMSKESCQPSQHPANTDSLELAGVNQVCWKLNERQQTSWFPAMGQSLASRWQSVDRGCGGSILGKQHHLPQALHTANNNRSFPHECAKTHLQLSHWYAALKTDPPHLDPLKFGFEADETNKVLNTVPLPAGVELAPDFVLKLIKYGYESSKPCKGGNCGCYNGQTPCTMFCACSGGEDCNNPFKKHVVEDESDSELGKQLRLFWIYKLY